MSDQIQPQAQPAAGTEQQAPMPSAEQQAVPQEASQSRAAEAASSIKEESVQQQQQQPQPTSDLPDGVKERTAQQFDKLKNQLATERERRLQLEQSLGKGYQQQEQGKPQTKEEQPWYNPETNEVDVSVLNNKLNSLEQRAQRAESQLAGYNEQSVQQQTKEAFDAYPELNPKAEGYDQVFDELVAGHLFRNQVYGKNLTMKEAAEAVRKFASKGTDEARNQGAQQAIQQLTPKEQASLEATGRSDKRTSAADMENLQQRSRRGDFNAIAARLRALGGN
jgi:hypothetical protein